MHRLNGNAGESEKEIQSLSVDPVIANEFVGGEIASWAGVRVREHMSERIEFWLNKHCLGYLPDPPGEYADAMLKFPAPVLDDLAGCGRIQGYTMDRDNDGVFGWATVSLGTIAEIKSAIQLFRLRYQQVTKEYE